MSIPVTTIIIGAAILLYLIIMVKIQYGYIIQMQERQRQSNLSQNKLYEKMSFQEEQLHFHIQSHYLTGGIAYLIYKIRHRHAK